MTDATLAAPAPARAPMYLIGMGHLASHWVLATFFIVLPYLTRDLGLSYTAAGALVSVLHISAVIANLGAGALVDITGRRVLMLAGSLLITAAALFVLGITQAYLVIAAMVALIGASNNSWHPAAVSFLSRFYPARRGFALSIHATGASLGDMVAPLVAGALLLTLSWQHTATLAALPVFVVAIVFWFLLAPQDRPDKAAPGAGAGESYLRGLARLLRKRMVVGLCLLAAVRSMAQTGITVFLPIYLADQLRVSPLLVGGTVMALHLGGVIASPLAGMLSDRYGPRPVVTAGLAATTVLIIALTFISMPAVYVASVSVLGFVLYSVRPVMLAWLMDLAPQELRGSATSLMFGAQSALGVTMPLLGGWVADVYGLTEVFYVIAAVMLLANLVVLLLPRE